MAKHKISQTRLEQLEVQRKEYSDKLQQKLEQLSTIRNSTVEYSQDPTYLSLLERKKCYENKIAELDNILSNCEVLVMLEEEHHEVQIGSRVRITNHGSSLEFIVVDTAEADPCEKKVPLTSPMGMVILGKKLHNTFKVQTPRGLIDYQIVSIQPAFF